MKLDRALIPLFALGIAVVSPAAGQEQGAPGSGDQVQPLVDELRRELDRAERERLADPWFLGNLREILDRYDWPWQKRILYDDFSGRGPGADAPWRVTAGEHLIDWRYGLRSVIKPRRRPQAQETTKEEAIQALFGTLLQRTLGDKRSGQQTSSAPEVGYAAITAPVQISNAFAIEIAFTSRAVEGISEGRLEFGPYQGSGAKAGYRLACITGSQASMPSLELLRISPRGTVSTLEFHDEPINFQDNQVHTVTWTRHPNGVMSIRLDGQELIKMIDRGFRDRFDGLVVVNSGGDFALRQVTIDGTNPD